MLHTDRRFFALVTVFLLVAASAFAQSQPASTDAHAIAATSTAPAPEQLPFVDETGLIHGTLKYSDMVTRFGEPVRRSEHRGTRGERRGGNLTLAYPSTGLSFMIDRQHRSAADPIVDNVRISYPWVNEGPTTRLSGPALKSDPPAPRWIVSNAGMYVGMKPDSINTLIASHYHIRNDYRSRDGNGSLTLDDHKFMGARSVLLIVDRGYLNSITFVSDDEPIFGSLRRLLGPLIMIVLALIVGTILARMRSRMREAVKAEDLIQGRLHELDARRARHPATTPQMVKPSTTEHAQGPLQQVPISLKKTTTELVGYAQDSAPKASQQSHKPDESWQFPSTAPRRSASWAMMGRGLDAVQERSQGIRKFAGFACLLGAVVSSYVTRNLFGSEGSTLLALIVGIQAFGLVVYGLLLFAGLRNSVLGAMSKGILVVALLAYFVIKFVH